MSTQPARRRKHVGHVLYGNMVHACAQTLPLPSPGTETGPVSSLLHFELQNVCAHALLERMSMCI